MNRFKAKKIAWQKERGRRGVESLRKKNKSRKRKVRNIYNKASNYISKTHYLTAPNKVSLLTQARDETLIFLEKSIYTIESCKMNEEIYFDLRYVDYISADVVMYLIALINNLRRVRTLKIPIRGNLPRNPLTKAYIDDTGFYKYVYGLDKMYHKGEERFRISGGKQTDGRLVGKLCDFVCVNPQGELRHYLKRLYPMIIELMTNTGQHAYKKSIDSKMNSKWYIFAEKYDERIHFVFLDTGLGIPATIKYSLYERAMNVMFKNDASYIASALRGENRTETNERYRGKGLPGIYEDACAGIVDGLTIISGKGQCIINQDGLISENELPGYFEGTLFSWYFVLNRKGKRNDN